MSYLLWYRYSLHIIQSVLNRELLLESTCTTCTVTKIFTVGRDSELNAVLIAHRRTSIYSTRTCTGRTLRVL